MSDMVTAAARLDDLYRRNPALRARMRAILKDLYVAGPLWRFMERMMAPARAERRFEAKQLGAWADDGGRITPHGVVQKTPQKQA